MNPYDEGRDASRRNIPLSCNPYRSGTRKYEDWRRGYLGYPKQRSEFIQLIQGL